MDFVHELELFVAGIRLDAQLHLRVLAAAAGLLLVRVLVLGRVADRFAIGDLRLADVRFDVELALHAVDDDFEVQLAHAGENGLSGLGVGGNLQRRIFVDQLVDRNAQLLLVGLGLRLDRELNDGRREVDRLENHRRVVVADRVAGDGSLQTDAAQMSPARISLISSRLLACIFTRRPMRSFLPLAAFRHGVARDQPARVDADEAELADKRVGHDLEDQSRRTARCLRPGAQHLDSGSSTDRCP